MRKIPERVFRIQSPERVSVIADSAIYESLDPIKNLAAFTTSSPEICVVTLRLEDNVSDPVKLALPVWYMARWVMRDTARKKKAKKGRKVKNLRGFLLRKQYCSDARGPFQIGKTLPQEGSEVSALALAHLAAHLAIIFVPYASDQAQPLYLEEATFPNPHNHREFKIVYNWPLRLDWVSGLLGITLDYIDSCVAGVPDRKFLKNMRRQVIAFLEHREWEKDVT